MAQRTWQVLGLATAVTAGLAAAHFLPRPRTAEADENAPRVPVLVELFTSEGCSSCPPAEDELSRLDDQQPIPGVKVIPLAFHVDYWNRLGWADPFSTEAWTARQGEYSRSRGGRVYTPEAIVQGGPDCTGSDARCLRDRTQEAAAIAAARVEVVRSAAPSAPGTMRISVRVGNLPAVPAGDSAVLMVALVERGLSVNVGAGENAGRRLKHAPLARDLQNAGSVAAPGGSFEATLTVPAASRPDALRVVAFVQERSRGRVIGVGTL